MRNRLSIVVAGLAVATAAALTDTPLRFQVEIDRGLVDGLVRLGFIRPDERNELGAIIARMKRIGSAPHISLLA